ncbi:MAG TPA: hypothetical protein VGD44_06190, partial [Phenylobacterium sp.]
AWRRNPMYAALKGRAAVTWGTGKLVLAMAGRRTWLITPREELDLGEVAPGADLTVTERSDGGVDVVVRPAA